MPLIREITILKHEGLIIEYLAHIKPKSKNTSKKEINLAKIICLTHTDETYNIKIKVAIAKLCLCTLEAWRELLCATVKEQAQRNRDVKVDSKNVGLNGSAKAHSNFKVHKPVKDSTARCIRRAPDNSPNRPIQQLGAYPQL